MQNDVIYVLMCIQITAHKYGGMNNMCVKRYVK